MNDLPKDSYISGEQWGQCCFCGAITDIRENACFGCADAQSIIGTGVDMFDRSADGTVHVPDSYGPVLPVEFANDRLRLLIKNGWIRQKKE